MAFIAFCPILVVFLFLVVLRWPAVRAMPLGYVVTVGLAWWFWKMPPVAIAAASIKGLMICFELMWIIFGAIVLLMTVRESGAMAVIRRGFMDVSPDRRVQAVIVAWLFGSFIEGASGFGTPAAICGPLLLVLGFPAMAACVVALIIQCTAVTFGAVGTPIIIGMGESLDAGAWEAARAAGMSAPAFLHKIGIFAALPHAVAGTLIPLVIVCVMTRLFGRPGRIRDGLKVWRFALFSGLAFTVPYLTFAVLLGPEFPSLIGALIGLAIVVPAAKRKFLLKDIPVWDFPPKEQWDESWKGSLVVDVNDDRVQPMTLMRAWSPYVLAALLLVATRLPSLPGEIPAPKTWLRSAAVSVSWDNILNAQSVSDQVPVEHRAQVAQAAGALSKTISPLYLPGTILMFVSLLMVWLHRMSLAGFARAWHDAVRMLAKPAFALVFAVALVWVFIGSGVNLSTAHGGHLLESMPLVLAEAAADLAGQSWPFFAPIIGALGAFVAGSNTVSDMMFAMFQYGVADRTGMPHLVILGLQAFGGAAGNMITVHNVVAASATVGLAGVEGVLIRKTVWPMVFYLLVGGTLGLLFSYVLFAHVF